MIRLNPEELVVASFETTVDPLAEPSLAAATETACFSLDPTACTQCFVCPPATTECG